MAIETLLARVQILATLAPELALPVVDAGGFADWLALSLRGRVSLEEVREMNWSEELIAGLAPSVRVRLDQWLPEQVDLSRHRRLKVHYGLSQAPWIESRLQDFFGLKVGPSIAAGRVVLTLHLLAPNHRAVQVTRDLAGFWVRTYPEIRKELSRRYPRHPWPEDPAAAQPPPPRR